ncbi:hypothetical protein PgNI_10894 [Pyricularia grisea]|uniref:Uncharacterized protein n=1 Tax=Pyricularia grisea TaxID=148305 RepID=A0A6P8AZZ7_PYRGI|nr:hypothetical protein PgNI_10894 [Pyricularia grisea]TLD07897.1 hypothetical protein PgNI_10894 [Pyricularia grisea]
MSLCHRSNKCLTQVATRLAREEFLPPTDQQFC